MRLEFGPTEIFMIGGGKFSEHKFKIRYQKN